MKQQIFWVGIRESEIENTHNLFDGSITIFGSGRGQNIAFEHETHERYDYNQDNEVWDQFLLCQAEKIIESVPNCQFLFYDPSESALDSPIFAAHKICQPPGSLLELLANKFQTRQWLSAYVPILPYLVCAGESIQYRKLQAAFPSAKSFVVQSSFSCGGSGTWLLTLENQEDIFLRLDAQEQYAISPYLENSISPNVHLVVYPHDILVLPPSIQLLEINKFGFAYKGADYPAYQSLPELVDKLIQDYSHKIGKVLQSAGYRGVCGIDYLFSNGELYLMEVNARFQSSTFLLNKAMMDAGWNISVQAMHIDAFGSNATPPQLDKLNVPYSFYHYSYEPKLRDQLRFLHELAKTVPEAYCVDDDLNWDTELKPGTYLYKIIFKGAISSFTADERCRLNVNVGSPRIPALSMKTEEDVERLKLMLLSHGVRLSQDAKKLLADMGGFNHEEFAALDLTIRNNIYICAPFESNLSFISPFCVDVAANHDFFLTYFGIRVTDVKVRLADVDGVQETHAGILFHDITYLGNDRLRVYQRLGCYFKDQGRGCQFCDLPEDNRAIALVDIFQAVDKYRDHPKVRHYLIGGGSCRPDDDFRRIMYIARHIRDTTGKPIYLMSLPPQQPHILEELKECGITEAAFNIEVFDRDLARQYMPGKGAIPLSVYEKAFRTAVKLWGRTGNVRSIFIVGLEPKDSLLRGIHYVTALGVSPILSLFRPAEGTPLQDYLPPSDEEIWEIYQKAKHICKSHGMILGPSCPCCQDNCMTITF